jgi:tetratricopeptide (TPR) repeat protein
VGGFKVAQIEEIEELDDGRVPMRPVRHHLGISAFGVNAWTGKAAGDRIINEHDEAGPGDGHEELYVVTAGRARFELDGETVDAPAGTMVFAPPDVKRTAFAEEAGTTVVAVGAAPGRPYEVVGWEIWAPVRHIYDAGDYAAAADAAKDLIEANPEYPLPFYNLACCESLAGRKEDALEHLRHAVTQSDRLREFAKGDTDLDPIRDEPAFKELVG